MADDDSYNIPAASIGDTNLEEITRTNPVAAREIARLTVLMNRGEETENEFLQLCRHLYEVGAAANAEILLRRNLDFYNGMALYKQLFGTTKQDEFNAAVQAFETQFGVSLTPITSREFLIVSFNSTGGQPRSDVFHILARPFTLKVGYVLREKIEASCEPKNSPDDECLFMYFTHGVWEIADPMDGEG